MDVLTSRSIISNMFWRFAERMGAQMVTFVVSLILARLLEPEAYGLIAVLLVFISIADTLVTSSFGSALIQKKDADDIDFSSVFFFNIAFSLVVYTVVFVAAPYIEHFYGSSFSQLALALRVLALRIPITAINNVQQAYVSKHMIFKKFFFATLWGTIGAAIIGIILAFRGAGVWALVAQYLFNSTIDTIILWMTVRWRPKKAFSLKRLKILLSYGWKLLAAGLIDSLYSNMRTLIIGKVYSSENLAYYNRGKQFPGLVVDNINTTIISVMFPAIALIQNDTREVKILLRKAVKTSSYIIFPMLFGLAAIAEPIIRVLLTEKWIPAIPYLQIFCFIYIVQPISKPNAQVIKAFGRSDLYLALEIIKKVVGITLLIVALHKGVMMIAITFAAASLLNCLMDMIVGGSLVGYSFLEQLYDISFPLLTSTMMFILVYLIMQLPMNLYLQLFCQVVCGSAFYMIASVLFRNETLRMILNLLRAWRNDSGK